MRKKLSLGFVVAMALATNAAAMSVNDQCQLVAEAVLVLGDSYNDGLVSVDDAVAVIEQSSQGRLSRSDLLGVEMVFSAVMARFNEVEYVGFEQRAETYSACVDFLK